MTSPSETNVLLISPLHAAMSGGILSWTQRIVDQGLPDGYRMHVVDTGVRNKARARMAALWAGEGRRTVRIIASLLWQLTLVRPHIAHLNCSLSPRGIFRDLVCALLARLWGVPVVGHYHGNIPEFAGGRRNGISWWALRRLVRIAALNIALNQDSLACLVDLQHGEQRAPTLLPNFIQDSVFCRRPVRTLASSVRTKVLYVGWITTVKGCREILAVARQLSEADFILLGPVQADMEPHLHTLPSNVTLGGEVAPDVVLQQMKASDLFLFPSHAEGFPNAVLESMAVGLPVVATRVGAIPEMIEEGKGGLLISSPDTPELISALQILIADSEMRLQMGLFNRRKSQTEYAYSAVVARLISLYQQVLHNT